MQKIAIIGSGISGLSISYLLNPEYDITIFEKNSKIGGHANTANINYNGEKIAVDTGFIVYNFRTYFHLKKLFEYLKVDIVDSDMSFGIKDYNSNLEYSGTSISGLFAQRKNIFNYRYLLMIKDILKFNKHSIKLIENSDSKIENLTLEQFLNELKLGKYFKDFYLLPMASAIWSCPIEEMKSYPAKTFLQFFYNHGLLTITNQPKWYSVKNGSQQYLEKISANFLDKIKLNTEITKSYRQNNLVILEDNKGEKYEFDQVIFASHANQTFEIIQDKNQVEERILGSFKYSDNLAVLHNDENQMPKNKKAWASWIYLSSKLNTKTSLTYLMNNLQKIDHNYPLFVTLNPIEEISKDKIFGTYKYSHPIFDFNAIGAQKRIDEIQGKNKIWFVGAWLKYGFHEDGILSAVNIAKNFDVKTPW